MNREQAIAKAKNLRKHMTVARFFPENKDEGAGAYWTHETFDSISAAKRQMRKFGIGVALQPHEKLPIA